jgi:uncharacterized protein involved in tellurium resistance
MPSLYTRDNRVAQATESYITIDGNQYYDIRDDQNNILTYNGQPLYTADDGFVTISNNTPSQPITYNGEIISLRIMN